MAFAFDPERQAILLAGGDKAGAGQKRFYKRLIGISDERYGKHLVGLSASQRGGKGRQNGKKT